MSLLDRRLTALRLTFRWSTSSQAWRERIADVALIGSVTLGALITFLFSLQWWQILGVWAICLVPAIAFGAVGWLKLFGPVLYYDMIRQARQSKFAIFRFLYVLLLVFLLFSIATGITNWRLSVTSTHDAADIAQRYFEVFMLVQFITVVLLTPAYVGGAIAEEKDRNTLEFMLATDLLNREIVLSKLGSRLANLVLLVLTGLPLLSFLQFLGGVDPNLVLAGFAVTAMTIAGLAGVSILCSVTCKKPRDAIALAYLSVVAYYAVSLVLLLALTFDSSLATTPIWFGDDPPTLMEAVGIYNTGNLVALMSAVTMAGSGGGLATALPVLIGNYALFHGLLAVGCTALAIARLRRVALAQTGGNASKGRSRFRLWNRPRIGMNPMMWKERYCESGGRSTWIAVVLGIIVLAATFVPAGIIIWQHLDYLLGRYNPWSPGVFVEEMNIWVRTCNVCVGCLTLLAVAVRASTSITTERDKQTLDTLLTTPLTISSILFAKWTGSILSLRLGLIWLGSIWLVGLVTGGLHIVALPFVLLAWLIFASFAASLGLWFSAKCRSSLRATVFTILSMIGLGVGHWVLWMCCAPAMAAGANPQHFLIAHAGITPPVVMAMIPIPSTEDLSLVMIRRRTDPELQEFGVWIFVGLLLWSGAAGGLYSLTKARFRLAVRGGAMRPLVDPGEGREG
jgi:ABC-type transport system involved in multi-copper enzyme maturation permease subunit